MLTFIVKCKDLVKFIHNFHVFNVELHEKQKTAGVRALARPCPTRWGIIQQTWEALLASEQRLYKTFSARDFIKGLAVQKKEGTKVKQLNIAPRLFVFWKRAIKILSRSTPSFVNYQSDKVLVSMILLDFHSLLELFKRLLGAGIINNKELA